MDNLGWDDGKRIRFWGESGKTVIAIHGGPGASGDMGGLAQELSQDFFVIEPWQRISGDIPVNVSQHIEDLHGLVEKHLAKEKPALIGHSWGAMLALAFASAYPETVNAIVLVGCGTFDVESRTKFKQIIEDRKDPEFDQKIQQISAKFTDPSERMKEQYNLISNTYDFDLSESDSTDVEKFDFPAHKATWDDMVQLMDSGVYPQAFDRISVPVIMLHGSYDPHPGRMTFETLSKYIPQIEYTEFINCGHSPWKEKQARNQFYEKLKSWLRNSNL